MRIGNKFTDDHDNLMQIIFAEGASVKRLFFEFALKNLLIDEIKQGILNGAPGKIVITIKYAVETGRGYEL